jgi:serine/threonine protein kinase
MSEDPVHVKISDFGLAKITAPEDTGLKTFCGTLLYLAPEVFPAYADWNAGAGTKRRRTLAEASRRQRVPPRRYSQSVDMWSFGCVLYTLLCGSPPFMGQNKDAIFETIMTGHLDIRPLIAAETSEMGIAFIQRLLNIRPELRPSEMECLRDAWLYDGVELVESSEYDPSQPLDAINEEEEEEEYLDASRLSLADLPETEFEQEEDESEEDAYEGDEEADEGLPIPKKMRMTAIYNNYRSVRDGRSSSPEMSYTNLRSRRSPSEDTPLARFANHKRAHSNQENGSAVRSSGVFGAAPALGKPSGNEQAQRSPSPMVSLRRRMSDVMSLAGAESMVGHLNVGSVSSHGYGGNTLAPTLIRGHSSHSRSRSRDVSPQMMPHTQQARRPRSLSDSFVTPTREGSVPVTRAERHQAEKKQRNGFDRTIRLDLPGDTAAAIEPESREQAVQAVVDEVVEAAIASQLSQFSQLAGFNGSAIGSSLQVEEVLKLEPYVPQPAETVAGDDMEAEPSMREPHNPIWGRLRTLDGSFLQTEIHLTEEVTSYGRGGSNTHIVEPKEVRVPRFAFAIQAIPAENGSPEDGMVCISTLSKQGIWVNKTKLLPLTSGSDSGSGNSPPKSSTLPSTAAPSAATTMLTNFSAKSSHADRKHWIRLSDGDVVTVFKDKKGNFLSFQLELDWPYNKVDRYPGRGKESAPEKHYSIGPPPPAQDLPPAPPPMMVPLKKTSGFKRTIQLDFEPSADSNYTTNGLASGPNKESSASEDVQGSRPNKIARQWKASPGASSSVVAA